MCKIEEIRDSTWEGMAGRGVVVAVGGCLRWAAMDRQTGICKQGGEGSPVLLWAQPCPANEGTRRAEFVRFPQGNASLPRTTDPKIIISPSFSQDQTCLSTLGCVALSLPLLWRVSHVEVTLYPRELPCDSSSLGTEGWVARPFIPKVTHVAAAMIERPVFRQQGYSDSA